MSQRTKNGAYVDAMLKAYRRTLQKTLEQARSMEQVVADPTVKILADTPDKAVVWGFALGLHAEVAEVLRRNLEDASADPSHGRHRLLPALAGQLAVHALSRGGRWRSGSIFSGSGMPDIGGMFSAIGSIGSSPPSSSSGGGGFGGGGGGGGGGGSGSF